MRVISALIRGISANHLSPPSRSLERFGLLNDALHDKDL